MDIFMRVLDDYPFGCWFLFPEGISEKRLDLRAYADNPVSSYLQHLHDVCLVWAS